MGVDGSGVRQLPVEGPIGAATWTTSGEQILFTYMEGMGDISPGIAVLYVMDADAATSCRSPPRLACPLGTPSSNRSRKTSQAIVRSMASMSAFRLASLGQVSLHVRDIARAEQFYGETLGLHHVFTFGDLAFFDLDGTRLYLHRKDEAEWQPGSILYFVVDDIESAYAELGSRGVELTGEPHRIFVHEDTGLEEWMAFFADDEGNTLALMQQRAPS
jgi:predicted enzyme related to lactoylglutathione lyase